MSYVRTKDGKIVKIHPEGDVFTSRYEIIGEPKDTIEELCDEFVIKIGNTYEVTNEFDVNDIVWEDNTQELYGAIWTEWGLKYVAKMNEEGKLELWKD